MHFFQYKILLVMVLNATLIFFSVQVNPVYSFVILYVVLMPYSSRFQKQLAPKIQEAFESDINLDYY